MVRRLGLVTFTLLVAATLAWAQGRASGAILLVCNKAEDTLASIDPATLTVLGKTTTGRGPHEVTVTPDGKWAFVANYEGPGDTISVVDVAAMRELRRIPLGEYRGPHGIQVSRDGKHVYATCERSQAVIELDVATDKIVRAFKTDQNVTHMLALTPDEKKLYTANIGSGSSTAIDLTTGRVVAQIPTGTGCEGIAVTPDGRQVWTANRAADTLCVIDTATDKVVATLPCRGFPIRVKLTPDGKRALVSCAQANELAIFDVATRKESRRAGVGAAPVGILIEPDGGHAWIANTATNSVTRLDLKTLAVVGQVSPGQEPDGLAWVAK